MILWPGYYDVVILAPAPVRGDAVELSCGLRRRGGVWTLGKREFLPHISLYHIPVAQQHFEAFTAALQQIIDQTEWGTLDTIGFDMPVLLTSKPAWLSKLQRKVVLQTVR